MSDADISHASMERAAGRFSQVNLIADPLYGYIEITKGADGVPGEQDLLDTTWVQRLRRIHQLQSAWWVFPSAEHSRFVHLLGAMHLASLFARRVDTSLREAFPGTPSPAVVEETLRLAGLLHDCGHGPFGHFFDQEVLRRYGLDHEDVGRALVLEELGDIIASLRASPSGPFGRGESVDPMWVAWVMADSDIGGYEPPAWLAACKPILCGPATVDNLDYVRRDAYMCGIALAPVDVQRLVHYSFIAGGTLVLHVHGSGALEMFLASRLYMYTHVYHHRTGRRFDLAMQEVFAASVDQLLEGNPLRHRDQYLQLTDWSLLEAAQRWQREPPGTERRRLGDAWGRMLRRDLHWHLAYETIAHRRDDLSHLEAELRAALPATAAAARLNVDVVTARIAPQNPMSGHGFVVLYDPITGAIERTHTTDILARLPQHNQLVRVFTDDVDAIPAIHEASRRLLS
ncbi:MAG: HD domain-containing protein [Candidatus Dormibacteria bacterium]